MLEEDQFTQRLPPVVDKERNKYFVEIVSDQKFLQLIDGSKIQIDPKLNDAGIYNVTLKIEDLNEHPASSYFSFTLEVL